MDTNWLSRKSNRQAQKPEIFPVIATIIAVFVILMIGSMAAAIVIGGASYLKEAFKTKEMWFSIRLSLSTAFISTTLCMLLTLPAAYALTRTRFPLKKWVEILLELTLSLPYLVIGLSLLILFSSDFGKWLKSLGFRVVFDQRGIVIAQLFVNLPFALRMVRTAFENVDRRLERIAGLLGASAWKQFMTITLPLCRTSIGSAVVMVWSRAIGEFGGTLMLVGVTRMKTETLPASIFLNVSTGDNGLAMASATVLLFISAVTLLITSRLNTPPDYYRLKGG